MLGKCYKCGKEMTWDDPEGIVWDNGSPIAHFPCYLNLGKKDPVEAPKVDTPVTTQSVAPKAPEVKPEAPSGKLPAGTPAQVKLKKWLADEKGCSREMVGVITRETEKAIYFVGNPLVIPTVTCLRCGRELTNPFSRMIGYGPECITHVGFPAGVFESEDDAMIKKLAEEIIFEGWLPKSKTEITYTKEAV